MASKKQFKLGATSKRNILGIHPSLLELTALAIQLTPVDYGHGKFSGVRAAATQNQLYRKGVSKADGFDKLSKHQIEAGTSGYGEALDYYALDPITGKASWKPELLTIIGAAFLQSATKLGIELDWGGLWSPSKEGSIYGWDAGHLQLVSPTSATPI